MPLSNRRPVLISLAGIAAAGLAYSVGAYREAGVQTAGRLFGQSSLIDTRAGALEYAVAGYGPPLMMIHGTGGGFDQGLLFAARLRQRGFRIVAPSRFGYLGPVNTNFAPALAPRKPCSKARATQCAEAHKEPATRRRGFLGASPSGSRGREISVNRP